jgi:hypothetical protein
MSKIRISYNTLVYAGEDISKGIAMLAKFGYDGVDFVGEPARYDTAKICTLPNENKYETNGNKHSFLRKNEKRRGGIDYVTINDRDMWYAHR